MIASQFKLELLVGDSVVGQMDFQGCIPMFCSFQNGYQTTSGKMLSNIISYQLLSVIMIVVVSLNIRYLFKFIVSIRVLKGRKETLYPKIEAWIAQGSMNRMFRQEEVEEMGFLEDGFRTFNLPKIVKRNAKKLKLANSLHGTVHRLQGEN